MNKPTEKGSNGSGAMDDVGRLIKHVGAREAVQKERFERARQNVRAHWEHVVTEQRAQRRPHRLSITAIAAGIVIAAGAAFLFWTLPFVAQTNSLASIDRVLGEVLVAHEIAGKGTTINANTSIVTGNDSRIALRMSGGQSLRIDTSSHVTLLSSDHLSLEAGAIYIDTTYAAEEKPILVSTPLGTAQDIGTQFQVRVTGLMLVVGVRQGLVKVSRPEQESLSINKGQYIELNPGGESKEHVLQPNDPNWDWIETVAPEFAIQNASLEQYLQWYAHENGVDLVWADKVSAVNARKTLLTGSIAGSSLHEGLLLVKQIAPFEHQLSGHRLWVKVE